MSARSIVSDHLVLRWIERVYGQDMGIIHAAMDRMGYLRDSDGQVLEFIEAYTSVDVAAIRKELLEAIAPAVARRAVSIRYKNFLIRLRGSGVTVVPGKPYKYQIAKRLRNQSKNEAREII